MLSHHSQVLNVNILIAIEVSAATCAAIGLFPHVAKSGKINQVDTSVNVDVADEAERRQQKAANITAINTTEADVKEAARMSVINEGA